MQVPDLQRFVRNQAELLAQAGAKTVANDFERFAAGLAPFAALNVAQLADFLVQAESYARTGLLPTSGKAARKKAAPVDSAQKIRQAAQHVSALYERALDPELTYAAIDLEVQSLSKMTLKDLVAVAREVGINQTLKTKKAALDQLARKVTERKESYERIQFRPEPARQGTSVS